MRNKLLQRAAVLIVAVGLGTPVLAFATPSGRTEDFSLRVSYADLNIDNEAGARVLYTRLQNAAAKACGAKRYAVDRKLSRLAKSKRCYARVLASAVDKVDSRALAKIHNS